MAGYSETVNLQINAIGNFSNVIGEVNKLQSRLQSLKLPANLNGKFESSLKDIINKYNQFQSLAEKGVQTKGDFSKLNNSARDFENSLRSLRKELTGISEKDIRVRVNNLPEVKELEEEIKRLSVTYKDLQHLGTNKISGSFGEKEVQNIRKLVGESKTLKPLLEQAFSTIKTGNIDDSLVAINRFETALNKIRGAAANQFGLDRKLDIQKYINEARLELERMGNGASEVKAKLDQIKVDRFNQMKNGISGAVNQLDRLGDSASRSTKEILETARASQNVGNQLSNLQTQANYFFGLQNMLQLFRRGLRDTIQTVRDLDKAMTDTAVVTDMTVSDLWAQLPDYTKLANKLGATTQGAYETMTLYYQQGLNKQETFEIGEETMKMARIAGLDYAQTTNMMTAALRGFNMELNQTSAKRVNDVYSELAAITASDTRELGLAMERTASIAHSANMDFGNTTAFLAQMIETTREAPENLGTAMKTIIARFQELKENPYKISEVEGEEVDFNRVDKALKSIGVDLMDNRDKFRDLDDVFMDISSRWDGLSQTQQRYVATIAAGARQQSRFLAMVQNYDRLKQLTDAAANSEGASDVQFSKTLDSMEAKLNKLNNAWQQFTMGITNNELIKSGTGFLVKMLDAINKFETGIEHLGDNIGGVFGDIFKSITSFSALLLGFKGLGKLTDIGIGMLGGMLGMGKGTKTKMFGGMSGIRQATNAAQAKAISNPIVAAIEKATSIITKTPMASKQAQEGSSPTKAATKQNLVEARQKLNYLGSVKGNVSPQDFSKAISGHGFSFTYKDVDNIVKDFDKEVQTALYRNQKGTRKALERTFNNSLKNMNISDGAKNVASNLYSNLDYQMATGRADISKTLGTLFNPTKLGRQIGGDYGTEIRKAALKEYGRIRQEGIQRGYKGKELIQFVKRNKGSQLETTLNEKEIAANTSRMQNFTSSVNSAGSAMMQLGMTFQSIGFGRLGGIISTLGSGLLSLGMTAEVAANGFRLLKTEAAGAFKAFTAAAPMMAVAAGAFIAAFAAYKIKQKQIKEIRKSGKEVVDAYEETTKSVETNLNKLNKIEPDWNKWIAGVDNNGNNINLGTEEYQDYKKAVKDIIKMHPELIKGYNAEGDAIIDNSRALKDAKRLEEERQKTATKEYLDNGQKIIDRRNSTKRWQNGQQQTIEPSMYSQGAGSRSYEKSTIQKDAQEVADAIKKIDGGEDLLKKWNVTFDSLGNITQNGIAILRDHAGDFQTELTKTWENPTEAQQELLTNSNDAIAQLGKDFKGIEDVSKETFDALKVYATDQKLFETIDSDLVAPFQTAISRIAEQDLSWPEAQKAVDDLGKKYQNLGGYAEEFNSIQEKVEEAQEQFGKDLDASAYKETVENLTAPMDKWIEKLRSSSDQADRILADWAENQKEKFENIGESLPTLSEAFNTWSGEIASANSAYENWTKQNEDGDLYTGVENFKKMMDEVNDEVDNLGRGSNQWWTAAQAMFGEDYIFKNGKDAIQSHMKEVQEYLKDGQDGVDNFLIDIRDKFQEVSLDDTGLFEKGKTIGYYIKKTAEGNLDFSNLDVTSEQLNAIAEKIGLSGDLFTSLINKARQFYDIRFGNVEDMRKAIAGAESTLIGNGETSDGNRNIYSRRSDFVNEALTNGVRPNEIKKYIKELQKSGVTLMKDAKDLTKNSGLKDLSKYIKDWGISQGKTKTDIGKLNQTSMHDLIAQFNKAGYSKDEIQDIYEAASEKGMITGDEKENFNEVYNSIKAAEDPVISSTQSIESSTQGILSGVNAIQAGMGILTKETRGEVDKSIKDATDLQKAFMKGDQWSTYDEFQLDLEDTKAGLQDTLSILEKGQSTFAEGTEGWKQYDKLINKVKNKIKALEDLDLTEEEFNQKQTNNRFNELEKGLREKYGANAFEAMLNQYMAKGFGNTNLGKRQELTWTNKQLNSQNFENAKTWGMTPQKGEYSTYMGSTLTSKDLGDKEGQYALTVTPMLQTKSGKPEVLSKDTVTQYMQKLLDQSTDENGTIDWSKMFDLDANPEATGMVTETGEKIHGLLMAGFEGEGSADASYAMSEFEHILSSNGLLAQDTSVNGLDKMAQSAAALNTELSKTGTEGTMMAQAVKDSFIDLNVEGLKNLDSESLQKVLTDLGATQKDLDRIKDTHPEIDIDAMDEDFIKSMDKVEEEEDKDHEVGVKVTTESNDGSKFNPQSMLENGGFIGNSSDKGLVMSIPMTPQPVNKTPETEDESWWTKFLKIPQKISEQKIEVPVTASAKVNEATKGLKEKVQSKVSKILSKIKGGNVKTKTTTTAEVKAKTSGQPQVSTLYKTINKVKSKVVDVTAKVSGTGAVQAVKNAISSLKDKVVNLVTVKKTRNEGNSGAAGINNHISHRAPLPTVGSLAKGTKKGTLGPKNRGGMTLTGEKGFEVAWLPSENRSAILGENGPQMVDLPKDAVVWNHEQSKKIMKGKFVSAGSLANTEGEAKIGQKNKPGGGGGGGSKGGNNDSNSDKKNKPRHDKSVAKYVKEITKKIGKTVAKQTKIQQTSGKINLWWWNMTKKVEATQRRIDKISKEISKSLSDVITTIKDVASDVSQYIKDLNLQIKYNTQMSQKADKGLKKLDKGNGSKTNRKIKKQNKKVDKENKDVNKQQKRVDTAKYLYEQAKAKKASKNKIKAAKNVYKEEKKRLKKEKKQQSKQDKKLKNLQKGTNWSTVSYKVTQKTRERNAKTGKWGKWKKEKVTKKDRVDLSKFVYWDEESGSYQIDYKKINKKYGKNKSKAKAVGEAAKKKVEDLQNKKNTADDNIQKAQEALEELSKNLYETFYAWKNELTDVWELTKKIEDLQAKMGRADSYISLLEAQLGASKSTNLKQYMKEYNDAFSTSLALQVKTVQEQAKSIEAQQTELEATLSHKSEDNEIVAINKKISESALNKLAVQYNETWVNRSLAVFQAHIDGLTEDKEKQEEIIKKYETKIEKESYKLSDQIKLNEAKEKLAEIEKEIDNYETLKTDRKKYSDEFAKEHPILSEAEELGLKEDKKQLLKRRDIIEEALKYLNPTPYSDGTFDFNFDQKTLEEEKLKGTISTEKYEQIKEYIEDLLDKNSELNSSIEQLNSSLTDIYSKITELNEQWAEYSMDLLEYVEEEQKDEIDRLTKLSDSINDTLKDLLDNVKKNLEARRQREDNTQTELDISRKQQRLAALEADTSGGNQVEIAQLRKEIADNQKDYGRTLEDQLLDRLQDSADEAQKQRERQISLLENLNSTANNVAKVNEWMSAPEYYEEEIRQAYYKKEDYDNVPIAEQNKIENDFKDFFTKLTTNRVQLAMSEEAAKLLEDQVTEAQNLQSALAESVTEQKDSIDAAGQKVEEAKTALIEAKGAIANLNDTLNNTTGQENFEDNNSNNNENSEENKGIAREFVERGAEILKSESAKAINSEITSAVLHGAAQATVNVAKTVSSGINSIRRILHFDTGGLANFTGPAWLDGTPSKPELVLNSADTKNFLALRDVLSNSMGSINSSNDTTNNSSIYEININVDHINNDYDVDKIAERVKKDIIKTSGYRNVTQVRNLR